MNNDQVTGIIRAVVAPVVAFLVAKGILPSGAIPEWLIPSVFVGATVLWSYFSNATGKVNGLTGGIDALTKAFTAAMAERDAELAKKAVVLVTPVIPQ